MSIDISGEQILTLTQAAKSLPGRPNISTLWRWYTQGVRGCRLETVMIGGRRYTSVQALQRFADRLSRPADKPGHAPTTQVRQRNVAAVERELDVAGI